MSDLAATIKHLWMEIKTRNPEDICHAAKAFFQVDRKQYRLQSFDCTLLINPHEETVTGTHALSKYLLSDKHYFYMASILWYLARVKPIEISNELIKPEQLPGGQIFVKGTHVLPLAGLVQDYEERPGHLQDLVKRLGGVFGDMGDLSFTLFAFPRVPMTFILWQGDEDFAGHAGLLFDSTAAEQLSTDILWATAMVTINILSSDSWK